MIGVVNVKGTNYGAYNISKQELVVVCDEYIEEKSADQKIALLYKPASYTITAHGLPDTLHLWVVYSIPPQTALSYPAVNYPLHFIIYTPINYVCITC